METSLGDRRTLARQIADDVRQKVRAGDVAPGDRLPSTREMKSSYDVSTQTVQAALALLKSEGIVESVPGRATYVRPEVDPDALPDRAAEEALSDRDPGSASSELAELRAQVEALREEIQQGSAELADRLNDIEHRLAEAEAG